MVHEVCFSYSWTGCHNCFFGIRCQLFFSSSNFRDSLLGMYADVQYTSLPPSTKENAIAIQCSRPVDSLNEGVDLASQSTEFLLERVLVLERQLKIRNADCARLLAERHQLKKGAGQDASSGSSHRIRELEREVAGLKDDLANRNHKDPGSTHRTRELEREVERLKSENDALSRRLAHKNEQIAYVSSTPQTVDGESRIGSRVTIVNTDSGPQVIYDSGVPVEGFDVSYASSSSRSRQRGPR